jgi:hypothetical protein
MRTTIRRLAFLTTTCGFLLACDSGSSTGPDDQPGDLSGSIKFSYTGAGLNGTFDASGKVDFKNGLPTGNGIAFGLAYEEGQDKIHSFFGSALKQNKSYADEMHALLSEQEVGTYTIGIDCVPVQGTVRCAYVDMEIDVPLNSDDDGAHFILISGELKVTSVSDKRLKGTFSGIGASDWGYGDEKLTISNGSFDVPIVPPSMIPGLKSLHPGSGRPLGALRP